MAKASRNARPRAAASTKDKDKIAKATRESPVRHDVAVSAGVPDYGIAIVVPDGDDLDLGSLNTITPQDGFPGRAVLFPPGSVDGVDVNGKQVDKDQFTFVAYIAKALGPTAVFIPLNASGVIFADLPNGPMPPAAGITLFDAISSAIQNQIGPPPPDGTGNGGI
jgi:hypothetical protein